MADTESPTREQVVTLTENAREMALKFISEEEQPEGKVLRIGVNSGGCSGFQYAVSIDAKKDDDIVQRYEGFEAVIDPISKQFLDGATLDYVDEIGHAGFKFDNPQAKSSCGCGTSFDIG